MDVLGIRVAGANRIEDVEMYSTSMREDSSEGIRGGLDTATEKLRGGCILDRVLVFGMRDLPVLVKLGRRLCEIHIRRAVAPR